jgi:hypothetical protein
VQLTPQPPQWLELLVVLTSQPLFGLPSQLAKPGLQLGAHVPFEQATPPFGFEHGMLQPPQWLVLLRMLVSQPLFGLPSQLPAPAAQLGTHAPETHAVVPFALLQVTPQAPQLVVVVCRFVSQPSARLPLQLPQPGAHTGAHAPAVQEVVP